MVVFCFSQVMHFAIAQGCTITKLTPKLINYLMIFLEKKSTTTLQQQVTSCIMARPFK
jgi:hypothetical protein